MNDADPTTAVGLERSYRGTTATLNEARLAVDAWLARLGADPDLRDSAALIVSELTSNAVQASPDEPYHVVAASDGDDVVLQVTNRAVGEAPPPKSEWGPDDVLAFRGRGLSIVDALASDVEVDRSDPTRITVTARLPLSSD